MRVELMVHNVAVEPRDFVKDFDLPTPAVDDILDVDGIRPLVREIKGDGVVVAWLAQLGLDVVAVTNQLLAAGWERVR